MGRITSTQAIFFSPGTNWAGEKTAKDKDKGWFPHGIQKTEQETEGGVYFCI